jgi:hypothetical protein
MTTLYLAAGCCRVPVTDDADGPRPEKPWVESFLDECAAFNGEGSGKDDQVDAFTMACSIWTSLGGGTKIKL